MRKLFIIALSITLAIGSIIVSKVLAEEETTTTTTTTTSITTSTTESSTTTTLPKPVKPIIKGINLDDLKQSLSIQEKNGWRLGQVGSGLKENTVIYIKAGKLTEVGSNYIKVEIFGNIYKIILDNTKLYRQGWGASDLDEFSVGDIINVYGYLDNDNTTVSAINVRDLSIIKLQSSIKGIIKSIDTNNKTFTIETNKQDIATVKVDENTDIIKFIATSTPSITVGYIEGSFSDLVVDDLVIVRGVYNSTLKIMNADVIIIGADERPYFKSVKQKGPEAAQSQLQEIQKLIDQLREQFRIKFK